MASEFERYVKAIHETLADETVEYGLFGLAQESLGALRRVIWVPTKFTCDNNRHSNFGASSDGSLFADELFVECHIAGADFADSCELRSLVLNATRQTLGTGSRPIDGVYRPVEDDDEVLSWGANAKIIQRFAWQLSVPEVDVFTARVRTIAVVDGTQITTTSDDVLTPTEQMDITE